MVKARDVAIVLGVAGGVTTLIILASRGVEAQKEAVAEGTCQDTGTVYDTRTKRLTISVQFWKTLPRPEQKDATLADVYQNTPFEFSVNRGKTWVGASTTRFGNYQITLEIPSIVDEVWFRIAGILCKEKIEVTFK